MRHAFLFLIFYTVTFCATAQRAITLDSTWVFNSGGVFFETSRREYNNGEAESLTRLLGDTSTVLNLYKDRILNTTMSMAGDVEYVSDFARRIRELIRQDAPLTATIGKSPIKAILAPVDTALIDSLWNVRVGGVTRTLVFSLNAQGNLRYKVDTFATRNATYLGDAIRLSNWMNSGQTLDIYRFKNQRWYSLLRDVQLYWKSQGAQNRTEREGPHIAPLVDVVQAPILYEGGYTQVEGVWRKWNAKSKKWNPVAKPPKNTPPSKL